MQLFGLLIEPKWGSVITNDSMHGYTIEISADACKNVSSFEIIMLAGYGPHSWF
jgi:hypothetical protein